MHADTQTLAGMDQVWYIVFSSISTTYRRAFLCAVLHPARLDSPMRSLMATCPLCPPTRSITADGAVDWMTRETSVTGRPQVSRPGVT
jgi:hypothetical protein